MDAESSQTSTKFYLNDPKFITLYKPSGDSEGTEDPILREPLEHANVYMH